LVEGGTAEVGTAEGSTAEIGLVEVGTAEVGIVEGGTTEIGKDEDGLAEVGTTEVGKGEVGMVEVDLAEVGTAEFGTAEVGLAEVGKEEVGTAEVGTAEIRCCLWMLLSPYIPNVWSLLQHFQLVLICHVDYLLCSALIIEGCGYDCKHVSICFSIGDGSPLPLLAKCPCSLRHDTGKPCLSKYITCC